MANGSSSGRKSRLPRIKARSWGFVVVVGLLLALVSIIDRGGLQAVQPSSASAPCQFTVNADTLNVRAEPSTSSAQVQQLSRGTIVAGTNIVTNGFRQLADGHWALNAYLTPVPGTTCG